MKESTTAQLIKNCEITGSKVVIEVCDENGSVKEITLNDSDDFMNDVVKQGAALNLVFSDGRIYTGIFYSFEDEDGEYVIYILPEADANWCVCLPYRKLVGYYIDNAS